MKETISMPVSVGEGEKELSFEMEDEVMTLRLDGKEVCRFDYYGNFQDVIKRMGGMWD